MPPEQVDAKTAHYDLLAQLVRALPCHGRGCEFKSRRDRQEIGAPQKNVIFKIY